MSGAPTGLVRTLDNIVGREHAIEDLAQLQSLAIDGLAPRIAVRPVDAAAIAEILRFCTAEKLAVVPLGAGTKRALGAPPARYDVALLTTRMNRILSYDPGDLTVSVEAGATLAALNARLGAERQFLPLEVPFAGQATIGGTAASGVDSPLRQRYGSMRDFLLGAEFVSGEAVTGHSGGRVVKNVAGYDLHKLFLGSLGTLGVLTRLNFKTFPRPDHSRGFLSAFSTEAAALAMLRSVASSPLAPSTLEMLDPAAAALFSRAAHAGGSDFPALGSWFSPTQWLVAVGFGGTESVLARIAGDLERLAAVAGATQTELLADDRRPAVWDRLREALPLLLGASPLAAIVRIGVPPNRTGEIIDAARRQADHRQLSVATMARAVGVVYIAFWPAADANQESSLAALASAVADLGTAAAAAEGFSSVPWASTALKSRISVWGPDRPDFALMRRVKRAFDPAGTLSPGRFVGGI